MKAINIRIRDAGRNLSLFFHTLRYLKVKQLGYQLYYRVRLPVRPGSVSKPILRGVINDWLGAFYLDSATSDGETFEFLGQVSRLDGDWNSTEFSKLWLYNLHYQDYLNTKDACFNCQLGMQMVDAWILGNPPISGNGWEPYCLSLRIVNWVKFFSRIGPGQLREEWLESLAVQADALEQQLEFHILANHLLSNAKALVFVGSYLGGGQGNRWLEIGLELLDREFSEQFLKDGAHYERSPMYQGTLLWDIADLIMLARQTQLSGLKLRLADWQKLFCVGLDWMISMSHPDGGISFFNDAAFGIAPDIEALRRYAALLDLPIIDQGFPDKVCGKLLQESGYGVVEWPEKHYLLADIAPLGPDYQPGHAHADTLSCELSLYGYRVLVNSGISEYGEGTERHRQRSTAAHNTVEVDGKNSSEVWSGFRVARRARPCGVSLEIDAGQVVIEGNHDGYMRLPGKVKHRRRWEAGGSYLEVQDYLCGDYETAVAHWHFHPAVIIEQEDESSFIVVLPGGERVRVNIEVGIVSLQGSTWHPEFGVSVPNRKLLVASQNSKMILRIDWRAR